MTKTNDSYYKKYAEELRAIGVSEEKWAAMESRESRIRELVGGGFSHRRATEIVYNIDLSDNPDWGS